MELTEEQHLSPIQKLRQVSAEKQLAIVQALNRNKALQYIGRTQERIEQSPYYIKTSTILTQQNKAVGKEVSKFLKKKTVAKRIFKKPVGKISLAPSPYVIPQNSGRNPFPFKSSQQMAMEGKPQRRNSAWITAEKSQFFNS